MRIDNSLTIEKKEDKCSSMLEFSLHKENDLKRAAKWLSEIVDEEAAQQFIFVLTAMREKSWANHCDKAVKSLGFELTEHWGGEESFLIW